MLLLVLRVAHVRMCKRLRLPLRLRLLLERLLQLPVPLSFYAVVRMSKCQINKYKPGGRSGGDSSERPKQTGNSFSTEFLSLLDSRSKQDAMFNGQAQQAQQQGQQQGQQQAQQPHAKPHTIQPTAPQPTAWPPTHSVAWPPARPLNWPSTHQLTIKQPTKNTLSADIDTVLAGDYD